MNGTLSMELGIVVLLAVFAASLWIPYIVGVNMYPVKGGDPFSRPAALTDFPEWVHRAHRAHLNLLEQSVPFAVLVLLVDRADGFGALTLWTSVAFVLLRVAHAVGYITGVAGFPARPLIFTAGWVCCLLMAWAFFTA